MREYGIIYTSFWTDDDAQALTEGAQRLFCYLLTGPHTTAAGCFRLPIAYASEDLKVQPERLRERFKELLRKPFAYHCEETGWVFIPHFLKFNPIQNPNCGKSVEKLLGQIPANVSFSSEILKELEQHSKWLSPDFLNRLANRFETVRKPFANGMPNQDQDQEQNQDKDELSLRSSSTPEPEREISPVDITEEPEGPPGTNFEPDPDQEPETGTSPVQKSPITTTTETLETPPAIPAAKVVGTMPILGGQVFDVTEDYAVELQRLFPGVDVMQALRGMKAWLLANPERQKTLRGIKRFITNWLERKQNQAPARDPSSGFQPIRTPRQTQTDTFNAMAQAILAAEGKIPEKGRGGFCLDVEAS